MVNGELGGIIRNLMW